MNNATAKTILFDFDGTIANTFDQLTSIYNKIAPSFRCKKVDRQEQHLLRGKRPQELMKAFGVTPLKIPLMLFYARKELNKEMDLIEPIAGIVKVLKDFNKRGIRMGIITSNSKKNVQVFLNKYELQSIFAFIHSGWNIFGKDKLIARFLKKHRLSKNAVVYVADETRDIEAAKRLGLRVIAVSWGFSSREGLVKLKPTAMIDSPEELYQACSF